MSEGGEGDRERGNPEEEWRETEEKREGRKSDLRRGREREREEWRGL